MRQFVAVCSLRRGAIAPHEPLEDAEQWRPAQSLGAALAADCTALQRRATARYQAERDLELAQGEHGYLRRLD